MSILQALFTAPGTNAAMDSNNQKGMVGSGYGQLFSALLPYPQQYAPQMIGQTLQAGKNALPGQLQGAQNYANFLGNIGSGNFNRGMVNQAGAEAQNQGMQTYQNQSVSNPGASPSLLQGYLNEANNKRASAANSTFASLQNPQNEMNTAQQVFSGQQGAYGAIGNPSSMGGVNSAMNTLGGTAQGVYGSNPQVLQNGALTALQTAASFVPK